MTDFTLADGRRVHLIGDPHLGRKFESGVPQHRRGERELSQSAHFVQELDYDADIIVSVGDLFDNPYVADAVIVSAARAALSAAERNESVTYIHMAGNHDVPRNRSVVGAWQAFREMVQGRHSNLIVVTSPVAIDNIAFFPWEWDRRADEQVADLAGASGIEHAVGHWDLAIYDGKDDHLAPVDALREAFGDTVGIWSGHYHKRGVYLDGAVTCTGSMEPYSHGEDPEGQLYVTLTLAEALSRDDLRDKYVRVILAPGEELPDIDCMGITHKREKTDAQDEVTVSLDDFDWHKLLRERIQERDPVVRHFIQERIALNVQPASEEQC